MPDNPIPDRWVNAVAEFRVPLDIPIDATPEQKVEAVVAAFGEDFPAQFDGADLRWEDVEDGESIRDATSGFEPVGNPEQLPDRSGPLPDFIGDTDVDIHTCHQHCPCQRADR